MSFSFALDDPPNRVKDMLRNTALTTPYVAAEPAPRAHAVEFENDRIRYQAVLCLDNPKLYRKLIDTYTTRVWYAAQRAGLRLPLPTTFEYQVKEPPQAAPDIEPAMPVWPASPHWPIWTNRSCGNLPRTLTGSGSVPVKLFSRREK